MPLSIFVQEKVLEKWCWSFENLIRNKMKIVFLDAYTLNSLHDLDLSVFDTLGDVILYDRTAKNEIVARTQDADIILTNKCP